MKITAVIPTKNRPKNLCDAIRSILEQDRVPEQLVVIDQSNGVESRLDVERMCAGATNIRLTYIHDENIPGLVSAKEESLKYATGDLICFLEDDVVLEDDYFHEIESGFFYYPNMLGCCGLVSKLGPMPRGYAAFFKLFHRGIFKDPRVGIHGHLSGKGHTFIPSNALSGGLSAWRKEVFSQVKFDTRNDFFMLEDIEFSTRATAILGERFFINPNARLDHRASPLNRGRLPARQRRKVREYIVFYKKRRSYKWAKLSLLWLLSGLLIESVFQTICNRSPSLLGNYFVGLCDGIKWRVR